MDYKEHLNALLVEIEKLHHKHELADIINDDYFEPGMMEHLDKYEGSYDDNTGIVRLCFESKGTRYGDRTEQIESLKAGDSVDIVRDKQNSYHSNNFIICTVEGNDIGNMPAELCNAIAPLYDAGVMEIADSRVSFVEPISKRSRYAKQAILFVELKGYLTKKGE